MQATTDHKDNIWRYFQKTGEKCAQCETYKYQCTFCNFRISLPEGAEMVLQHHIETEHAHQASISA